MFLHTLSFLSGMSCIIPLISLYLVNSALLFFFLLNSLFLFNIFNCYIFSFLKVLLFLFQICVAIFDDFFPLGSFCCFISLNILNVLIKYSVSINFSIFHLCLFVFVASSFTHWFLYGYIPSCVLVIFDYEFIFLETWEVFEAMLSYKVCEGRNPKTLFIAVSQALLQCLLYEVFNKYLLNDVCTLHTVLWLFIYMSISSSVLIMPQVKKFFNSNLVSTALNIVSNID